MDDVAHLLHDTGEAIVEDLEQYFVRGQSNSPMRFPKRSTTTSKPGGTSGRIVLLYDGRPVEVSARPKRVAVETAASQNRSSRNMRRCPDGGLPSPLSVRLGLAIFGFGVIAYRRRTHIKDLDRGRIIL